MISFPKVSRLIEAQLRHHRIAVLLLPMAVFGAGLLLLQAHRPAIVGAQGRPEAQLRSAAAANSEGELQRVESANPNTTEAALARFLRGYLRVQARDFATAATLLGDQNIQRLTVIGDYALYYRGQALAEAGRADEAEREYRRLAQTYPASLLARPAMLQAAGSAMLRSDAGAALTALDPLVEKNDGTALKLRADAFEKAGRVNDAINTLRKLYFDAPQSAEAEKAAARLTALGGSTAPVDASQLLRRADKLYQAGLFAVAAQAYEQAQRSFPNSMTDEAWLRIGLSYFKSNSFPQAATALSQAHPRSPETAAEALYYLGAAQLAMNNEPACLQTFSKLRALPGGGDRAGGLLYDLGRFNEKRNLDQKAYTYYAQLARQYPQSEKADEAHFWLSWRAHEAKDYPTAARLLSEHIANYGSVTENRGRAGFWAAMDADRAGNKARALVLFRAMLMRYGAGWYGVNAERRIRELEGEGVRPAAVESDLVLQRFVAGMESVRLPRETIDETEAARVRRAEQLMRIALYQSASNELDAARASNPDSPLVNLRIAQIFRAQGEPVAAINALKRSFPDYGQTLPQEMTREAWDIFYPLRWWTNIKEESRRHGIDPYFIAGLIRQETVFDPKARSRANALGLMQLLPYVGQSVARKTTGASITSNDLFNPVLNIQLGTAYVKEQINSFGRWEYVAAAYNGGPTRVRRWIKELPASEIEEWVEAIPISETRLYVQGVYRNARQYQRLYDDQGRFRSNVPE